MLQLGTFGQDVSLYEYLLPRSFSGTHTFSGVDVCPPGPLIDEGTAQPLRCLFPMKEPPLLSSGVEKLTI
jgi:hypothetical protein